MQTQVIPDTGQFGSEFTVLQTDVTALILRCFGHGDLVHLDVYVLVVSCREYSELMTVEVTLHRVSV